MSSYGTDDRDEVTVRLGPDSDATELARTMPVNQDVTELARTEYVHPRDDSAGYTVPGPRPSTPPLASPGALPRRVPAQFTPPDPQATQPPTQSAPPATDSSPRSQSRSSYGSSSSIRIGKGPAAGFRPARPHDDRTATRRWFGYATRILSGIATLILIAAAAWTAWQWWQREHNEVKIASVAVAPAHALTGCDVQYDLVGTVTTNGKAGTFAYEWIRSDGQSSGTLKQNVAAGQTQTTVHLYWTFTGHGSMTATATLHLIDPKATDGAATFQYSCA